MTRIPDEVAPGLLARLDAINSIVTELQALGHPLKEYYDISKHPAQLKLAFPVLQAALTRSCPEIVKLSAASYLVTAKAAGHRAELIDLLCSSDRTLKDNVRYVIACAVAATTTSKTLLETVELLRIKSLGSIRIGLLRALRRQRSKPEVAALVAEFLNDPHLRVEISSWRPSRARGLQCRLGTAPS